MLVDDLHRSSLLVLPWMPTPMKMSFFRLADRALSCNNATGSSDFAGRVAPAAEAAMVRRCTNSALDTMPVET
jgi:hypothetical protein